jgi:ATP-dependent DNA helicase RecQ
MNPRPTPELPTPEAILKKHFGYPGFRPGQGELVEAVLSGRDAIGILPTGGGKSVCYQVPALLLPGLTIVASPLLSLMADQVRRAREAGLPAESLHSELAPEELRRVESALLKGEVRLLLLAPERFQSERFRRLLPSLDISLLTIDEAHCISMWGNDFRPAYGKLGEVRDQLRVPVMALTATATPRVREEIEGSLRLRNPHRVIGSFDRSNLRWGVQKVRTKEERDVATLALLNGASGARLVYAATRKRVERVRDRVARSGLRAEAFHAGLPSEEKRRVLEYFLTDRAPIVVATNAFGMGIDRSDVRLVVHDQLPGSLEDYQQEAGRAGRDGAPALCIALLSPDDARLHRTFLDRSHPPVRSPAEALRLLRRGELGARMDRRRIGLAKIRGVARYSRSRGCRRQALLAWFGEVVTGRCGGCDRCVGWEELALSE